MKSSKVIILLIIAFFPNLSLQGADLSYVDSLHFNGEYQKSYDSLQTMFDPENPDPAIIWRIGRELFVIADEIPKSKIKEKINKFDEGVRFLEKYIDFKKGSARDRSSIVHWYTSNLALKSLTIGIFDSLANLDKIKKYNDLSIQIDPGYSDPYYFKASLLKTLPEFLGGSLAGMGYYYSMAIRLAPNDINVLIDSAKGFYRRNWSAEKINKEYAQLNIVNFDEQNRNDREYAAFLINEAVTIYESSAIHSQHDKIKILEAYKLKEKWAK